MKLLLLLLLPLAEIATYIKVGGLLGVWATIGLTIATAVIGVLLVRMQGFMLLMDVRHAFARGELPAQAALEGVVLLICGALLLVPGFISDALGFLGLIPALRRRLVKRFAPALRMPVPPRAPGQNRDVIEGDWPRE